MIHHLHHRHHHHHQKSHDNHCYNVVMTNLPAPAQNSQFWCSSIKVIASLLLIEVDNKKNTLNIITITINDDIIMIEINEWWLSYDNLWKRHHFCIILSASSSLFLPLDFNFECSKLFTSIPPSSSSSLLQPSSSSSSSSSI